MSLLIFYVIFTRGVLKAQQPRYDLIPSFDAPETCLDFNFE